MSELSGKDCQRAVVITVSGAKEIACVHINKQLVRLRHRIHRYTCVCIHRHIQSVHIEMTTYNAWIFKKKYWMHLGVNEVNNESQLIWGQLHTHTHNCAI